LTETPSLIRRALIHDTWCPMICLIVLFSVLPSHAQLLSYLLPSSAIFDSCVTRGATCAAWPPLQLAAWPACPQIKARSQSSGQPCHSVMSTCMGQRQVSATLPPVSFAWRPKYWVPAVPLAAAVAETAILAVRITVNRYLSGGGTYSGVVALDRGCLSLSPLSFFLFPFPTRKPDRVAKLLAKRASSFTHGIRR
jgi:hypothetical protein